MQGIGSRPDGQGKDLSVRGVESRSKRKQRWICVPLVCRALLVSGVWTGIAAMKISGQIEVKVMKQDRLSLCARRAKAMGLSYGQYMARKYADKPSPPVRPKAELLRTCHSCGEIFRATRDSQVYCCKGCNERARNRRKSAGRRKKLAFERMVRKILEQEGARGI